MAKTKPLYAARARSIMSSVVVHLNTDHLTFFSIQGDQYDGYNKDLLKEWLLHNPKHYRIGDNYFAKVLFHHAQTFKSSDGQCTIKTSQGNASLFGIPVCEKDISCIQNIWKSCQTQDEVFHTSSKTVDVL